VKKETAKAKPGHFEAPVDPERALDDKSYKIFKKARGTGDT